MAYPGDGSELATLLEYFNNRGKSTGLVTTTYVTHATPAAFGAHEPDRENLSEISTDYLNQTRPNVLFGGGANGMSSISAVQAGYTVVSDRSEMESLDTENITFVSGQFGNTHLPYEYEGLGSLPHLSEMISTALEILDNDPDGFFLMVEGGRIDHAGHANDIARNVFETVEFSNAIEKAIDWAQKRTDTLILVTADHETGGLAVLQNNGQGNFPNISWSTTGHTEQNVPIYAWGENAELVNGVMDNTGLFDVVIADTRSPTILFTSPADGTLDVPVNYVITATFSEAMDASTITTETFLVNDGSVNIVGEVTYNGTVATFRPTTNLDYDTNYTATITTGVEDLPGNPLQTDYSWSFATCVDYIYYRDADEDGYGDANDSTQACSQPSGYVTNDLDCDDGDPNEHPNQIWYKDADSDGYSDGVVNTTFCTRPTNFKVFSELISISGDCDDTDQNQSPGAPEVCNEEDDNCDGQTDEGCVFSNPPEADAGSNQTVVEGETVTLDGSSSSDPDQGDTIASYQWTQIGGIPATLSDPTAAKPTFITPVVSPGGMTLTFELVVKDNEDLQDSANVSITVNDNGIDGFPDDVLTMTCSTGKEIGMKVESGGDCVSITAADLATIPDSSDKPDNLPYGLFDLVIKPDAVGGTVKVKFYLESKAGNNDKWSKYKKSTGIWEDCSAYASFSAARDQVTLTLVDGGDGDDGPANGWIVDPSGLNASSSTSASSGVGGGGGCFIVTLTDG